MPADQNPYDLSTYLAWLSDTDRAELLRIAANSDDVNRPWRAPQIALPLPWPADLVIVRAIRPGTAPIAPPTHAFPASILRAERLRQFRAKLRAMPAGDEAWPDLEYDLVELCTQEDDALLDDVMPRRVRHALVETGLRARQVYPEIFGMPPARAAQWIRDMWRHWTRQHPMLVQVRFNRSPSTTGRG